MNQMKYWNLLHYLQVDQIYFTFSLFLVVNGFISRMMRKTFQQIRIEIVTRKLNELIIYGCNVHCWFIGDMRVRDFQRSSYFKFSELSFRTLHCHHIKRKSFALHTFRHIHNEIVSSAEFNLNILKCDTHKELEWDE